MGLLLTIGRLLYLMFEVTKGAIFVTVCKLMPSLEERKLQWMMLLFRDKDGAESAVKAFKPKKGGSGAASFFVFVKQMCCEVYNDLFKEARLNGEAPDCDVIELSDGNQKGNSLTNLLKFQKHGRPLVLNFGSCT